MGIFDLQPGPALTSDHFSGIAP